MPFPLRRPWLLIRGALLNRGQPDLARLGSLDDPERFAWAILPHVARSFAASIVVLPHRQARAALVGYLYARMLDTYEDLVPDRQQRAEALEWFGNRLSTGSLSDPGPTVHIATTNERQKVDRLLVERRALVDRLYATLPAPDQAEVAALITKMGANMQRWSEAFTAQGGLLANERQLSEYCDDVIGDPGRFVMALLLADPLSDSLRASTSTISEMIQLANVTRDIEHDLERGVAYHPALEPHLGEAPVSPVAVEQVRRVREELLVRALRCVPAYRQLLEDLDLPRISSARGSAVLLLLFTDRHYRGCAVRTGHRPWKGPRWTVTILSVSLLAVASRRWAGRITNRVEERFLDAAATFEQSR